MARGITSCWTSTLSFFNTIWGIDNENFIFSIQFGVSIVKNFTLLIPIGCINHAKIFIPR